MGREERDGMGGMCREKLDGMGRKQDLSKSTGVNE